MSKLARRGKIDPLRDALRYEEIVVDDDGREWDVGAPVRAEAAEALSQFDATAVSGNLVAALEDRAPAVRLAALDAIRALQIRVAGVVEQLVECVVTRRPDNAEVAERAVDVLIDWHSEGNPELLVDRLLDKKAPDLDDQHCEALDRLLGADSRGAAARDAVTERVLGQLHEPRDGRAELHAERILIWLGPPAADKVLEALDNGRGAPAVVRAAGLLGDARAVDPVVRGLESADPEMREAAAVAARNLNHTRAVPALLTATQDDDQTVRDAASAALDRMGTAAVIAGLAAVVTAQGLPGMASADLKGFDVEELRDADAGRELLEAEDEPEADHEREADHDHQASVEDTRPAPPVREPDPPQPGPVQRGLSAYYEPASRRRGGFLDRLFRGEI